MDIDLTPLHRTLPSDHKRSYIPSGVAGTAQTIERMIALIQHGKRDMRLRPEIGRIIAKCPQKDYLCYAKALHDFWCYDIKYAYDPVDVELIEDAYNMLKSRIGDCDSKCVGFCSMAEQIGLPCRLVTIKTSPTSDEYTHVFSEVKIPGKGWVTSDCTMPKKPFGWKPPDSMPRREWPISQSAKDASEEHMDLTMNGLAGGALSALECACNEASSLMSLNCGCTGPALACGPDGPCMDCSFGLDGLGFSPAGNPKKNSRAMRMERRRSTPRFTPKGPPKVQRAPQAQPVQAAPQSEAALRSPERLAAKAAHRAGSRLRGLGALSGPIDTVTEIYNGTWLQKLRQANADLNALTARLNATPSSPEKTAARDAIARSREELIKAQYQYNFIVGELNRFGAGLQTTNFLSSLGVLPAGFAMTAGIAAAVTAFLAAWAAWMQYFSDANARVRLAEQIRLAGGSGQDMSWLQYAGNSGGGITSSLGTALIVGAVAFVGFKMLGKRGLI